MMRAVVKTNRQPGIHVLDMPTPEIGPNEALVQIKACGICGGDLDLYQAKPGAFSRRGRPVELPRIIGHEPAGIVVGVGKEVRSIKVGDRVASDSGAGCGACYYCQQGYFNLCVERRFIGTHRDGAMAEYCAIPGPNLFKIPDSISFDEAAMLEPLGVAVRAMETLVRFKPGDDVAVLGPGPIGLLEAMLARAAGAGKIFVVGRSTSEKRLEFARQLGFSTINAERDDVLSVIRAATGGLGVDAVFDATSSGMPGEATVLLKGIGQLVITATMEGKVEFNADDFKARSLIITANRARNPSTWYRAINLVACGRVDVKPLITHRFDIENADTAFRTLQRREGMKVLIAPS
ncbi:MAG: alcohol dehydrogenase catalytic domain-containing protein [Chloroflexi bacterium]|nr:alcohol dehydrogenase catalytic domain-containing protein [Chloroflexota bacterium]